MESPIRLEDEWWGNGDLTTNLASEPRFKYPRSFVWFNLNIFAFAALPRSRQLLRDAIPRDD